MLLSSGQCYFSLVSSHERMKVKARRGMFSRGCAHVSRESPRRVSSDTRNCLQIPNLNFQVLASDMKSSSTVLNVAACGGFYHHYEEVTTAFSRMLVLDFNVRFGEYLRILNTLC